MGLVGGPGEDADEHGGGAGRGEQSGEAAEEEVAGERVVARGEAIHGGGQGEIEQAEHGGGHDEQDSDHRPETRDC